VVDGKDQSILLGAGRVYRMAQATLHQWVSNAQFDFVDGSHDGYCRLADPVVHRRKILFVKPEYWIIVDLLTGRPGKHRLEQYFHLMPWAVPILDRETKAVRVECDGAAAITIVPASAESLHAEVTAGATDPIQGWVSFFSGEKVAAPVVKYSRNIQIPSGLVTAVYPHPARGMDEVHVTALQVTASDGKRLSDTQVTGLVVETAECMDTCVIAHDGAPPWKAFAGCESDGDLVYIRRRKADGAISRATLGGGQHLSSQGRSLLDVCDLPQAFTVDRETAIGIER
jgi:hypothetical protein